MGTRNPRPVGWGPAVGAYITRMRAAGRAAGTITLHRHYLGQLEEHVGRSGPWTVSTRTLEAFMARPTWGHEARRSARTVVTGFYRWAHGEGWLEYDPAATLPVVKVPPPRARPTPEHLVAQLTRVDDRLGYLAMLMAYGGARCAEAAQVLPARDLVGDELVLLGKGDKERVVPVIHPPLLRRLRADARRGGWAFPNGHGGHLSARHVSKIMSAALPDGWTAHTLRHRFASTAYGGTRDLLAVSELLGHARVDTTQRYVKLPDDALRAAVAAAC